MFILFGFDKETRRDYGAAFPVICPRCHNPTRLRVVEIKKWFTLFLIPILPYESTYWLRCEICSHGVKLSDDQFEKAKRLCRAARAVQEERMSEERYHLFLERSRLLEYSQRKPFRGPEDKV